MDTVYYTSVVPYTQTLVLVFSGVDLVEDVTGFFSNPFVFSLLLFVIAVSLSQMMVRFLVRLAL